MRKPFLEKLTELAEQDNRIIFIVGDVGFSFIEDYKAKFSNQYLNCGVMEQSMMGIAAGLSRVGWKPYVYTMKNFVLLRPHEQVRNDIGFAKSNVKLFGVGGSEAYRFLGMSHNLFPNEEQDILKHIPNLNSYFAETDDQVKDFMQTEYEREGPAYFSI